jgi:hypothetical protein
VPKGIIGYSQTYGDANVNQQGNLKANIASLESINEMKYPGQKVDASPVIYG